MTTDSASRSTEAREALLRQRLAGRRGHLRTAGDIPAADRTGALPLSYGQQQLWFLQRLDADSTEYLVPLALRLNGPLDTRALAAAWQDIFDRHEVLRTRHRLDGAEPVQIVDPAGPVDLPVRDVAAADVAAAIAGELGIPFDLDTQWPARGRLLRIADDEHVLIVVLHHIACDAWSLGILGRELGTGYAAHVRGERPLLTPLRIQYADYAAWERGRDDSAGIAYWHDRLDGITPLDLPADRPRPAERDWSGDEVSFPVPQQLAAAVRALASASGTTSFAVLLAAFQVLLARYTGRTDIGVGTMVAGRERPELQDLIGYGINSLVLRAQWTDDIAFIDLVHQVRADVAGALEHQRVPFARLVDALEPARDMSRTPLFQVAFTLSPAQSGRFTLPGVRVTPVRGGSAVSRFDLTLLIDEHPDGTLGGRIEYATALFDRSTAERITRHYTSLLTALVADPAAGVADIAFLDADELAIAAAPARELEPVAPRIHELVAHQAARRPDAPAILCGDIRMSFAELDAAANRVAHELIAMGVRPGSLVGVCLHRDEHLVPTLLGVMRAGAAYLPLDPIQPAERLGFMLQDSGARVIVSCTDLRGSVATADRQVLCVDEDAERIAARPSTDPGVPGTSDDTIYLIYTSGSTGRPKGVLVTHQNVARLLTTTATHFAFGDADAWVMLHSYAFDMSVWEIWGALAHGGSLVVADESVSRDPDDILDLLVDRQITILNQTPSAFRALVGRIGDGDPRLGRLALRAVTFGGEKLEMSELAAWVDRVGIDHPKLINMYGITETTVHTTYHRVTGDDVNRPGNPIGVALGDLRVHLLDPRGNLVPVGVPGEIHVGGAGVALGYHGRPDLTADRFLPDPYAAEPGARMYRSGDLARWTADGGLEFLGRADDQVQLRGYRVEPGEIARAIAEHPAVRDCVVILREDRAGDPRLVAYLLPHADVDPPTPAELQVLLATTLPAYMIPSAFVTMERFPLTGNGKLDKRALPAPGRAELSADTSYSAPSTPVEQVLADVWSTLLQVEKVGVHDNFFSLGGHSIRAVAMVGELRSCGYDVSVRDVFEHRTIAALATVLDGRHTPAAADEFVAPFAQITEADRERLPADVVDAYPLSHVQAGMVAEMLADPEAHLYHNVTSFRVRDEVPFDAEVFRTALSIVVDRHDVLRTSLAPTGYADQLQFVHRSAVLPVAVHDLGDLDAVARERVLRAFTAAERADPFRPGDVPLVRMAVHTETNAWWLSVTEHHAILEGWSHHSMLMEVLGLYGTLRDGAQPALPALPRLRYADFIAAEQVALRDDGHRGFWRGVVEDHVPFTVPDGWGELGERVDYDAVIGFGDIEDELRALAARVGAPLKSVLVAAYLKVLSQLTHEPAFHTGLVLHGRPEVLGAELVFGMYLNTLPFPFRNADGSWDDLVARVFATETDMWSHRTYPMPAIQQNFGGGARLLQSMFIYLDFDQIDHDLVDYTASIDDSPTEFPLAVAVRVGHVGFTVDTRVISARNADRIAAMYREVLERMAADGAGDATVTVLPEAERRQLLAGTTRAVPAPEFRLPELLRQRMDPDAIAVRAGAQTLTYRELDERANRLARHLREHGVGRGDRVGVCLDRDADLIPTLLGVLVSGAAYLPLDPAQPADRLAHMVTDAGVRLVVTAAAHRALIDRIHPGDVVDLRADAADIARQPTDAPAAVGDADDAAYVIYTSGSTGAPKGVVVGHGVVAAMVQAVQEKLHYTPADVCTVANSYAFDVSVGEMWCGLLAGAQLVVVPADVTGVPDDFLDLLVRHRVTVTDQPPAAVRGLISLVAAGDPRVARLALRALIVGGEKIESAEFAPWARRFPLDRLAVWIMYGITETVVNSTAHRLTPADLHRPGHPIGPVLDHQRIHLLDARGELVPLGAPGEICIGGPNLAQGYLNRPDLTVQRFTPDPYATEPGGRLYRTGDLGSRGADGVVHFLGRIDEQIKIRGYRVEPGEIAVVVAAHPSVREAFVDLRQDAAGEPYLVAYVVPAGTVTPTPAELIAHCATTLPRYMVPTGFVPVPQIPVTNSGKVDRRRLETLDVSTARDDRVHVGPRDDTERRLVDIWQEILPVDRISVHDSFFDIGGQSIRAVALVGALRAAGFTVSVRELMESATVARLAELIADRGSPTGDNLPVAPFALVSAVDVERLPTDLTDAYPMSQVQIGMVLEMLADADEQPYVTVTAVQLRDEQLFGLAAFQEAVRSTVNRHEALRTSFALEGYSVAMQLVHPEVEVPVTVTDLRTLSPEAQEDQIRQFAWTERAAAIDLTAPPLLRVAVFLEDDRTWRLVLTECHAITEDFSQQLLLTEILTAYERLRAGAVPVRAALPALRYADFIAAERRSITSAEDRTFWREIVEGYPALEYPAGWGDADPAAPALTLQIPFDDLDDGLRALARAANAPLKAVLHAAHLKVLSQLSDQPTFRSALVWSGRPAVAGSDQLQGMYVNTLPFPADRTASTWQELVAQVFAQEMRMWSHRHLPLPVIQRELHNGQRLIDTMFSHLEGADFSTTARGGLEVLRRDGLGHSEFTLVCTSQDTHLSLSVDTSVIGAAHARRIADMYREVLMAMAAEPRGRARASYLPAGERDHLRDAGDGGTHALPDQPTHVLIAAVAAQRPSSVAVTAGTDHLGYGDLQDRADRLAHRLRQLGVRAGSRVGVLLDRSTDLVACLLAVWRTGAAYLPLDPGHPDERLRLMLDDADAHVVLTSTAHAARIGAGRAPLLVDDPSLEHLAADPIAPVADLDLPAYVIYTSGSTGRPKGVCVTHRGLANYLQWTVREYTTPERADAPLLSSVAFDLGVPSIFTPLLAGGTVHLLPQDFPLTDLGGWLAQAGPFGFVKLTPGHLELLTHQLTAEQAGSLAGVLVVGGEAFTTRLARRWRDLAGPQGAALLNEYGPTEATVANATYLMTGDVDGDQLPIGRPIPHTGMGVLDTDLERVPQGVVGQIAISGVGLALGYLGRPDQTAERFVPDPDGPPGARMYLTGDLGRVLADGDVEYLGRTDDQVKIRGYRIELGEIESVLAGHPTVRDVVVIAREDKPGDQRLVAYCVMAPDRPTRGPSTHDELTAHCGQQLPPYMVPSGFVVLDRIPLTSNGKVDRNALPVPAVALSVAEETPADTYEAPQTETERVLADIWAAEFQVDRVGRNDKFLELGAHSILIIRAIAAIRRAGMPVTIASIYHHETLAALAAAVDAERAAGAVPTVAGEQGPITGEFPLLPVQRWFLAKGGDPNPFVQSARLIVDPAPRPDLLAAALRSVVEHHDALRLRVRPDGVTGELSADIPNDLLDVVDLAAVPADERADAMHAAELRTLRSHDLTDGRTVRAVLFGAGPDAPAELLLSIHHMAVDIMSWPVLVEDLQTAYGLLERGEPVALPAKTTSYREWAVRLAERAGSTDLSTESHYWVNRMPAAALPVDHPGGTNSNADEATVTVALDAAGTTALIQGLVKAQPATAEEAIVTALAMTVTEWTGGSRFLMDMEGHGRQELFDGVDLSRTVGWFTTVYPVSLWLSKRYEPAAQLGSVAEQLRAVPDRGIGYGLLRHLSDDPDLTDALAELPEPQLLFNYSGHGTLGDAGPRQRFTLPPERLGGALEPGRPRTHLVEVNAGVHDGRLYLHWSFSGALHDEATIRGLAQRHLAQLSTLLAEVTEPLEAMASPVAAMAEHHVPAVSVTLIDRGEVATTLGYGTLTAGGPTAVTANTLFQAGSISKHVTAIGVLCLVRDGLIDLDADVNTYLTSWRLTGRDSVATIRQLLDHTAGLTVCHHDGCPRGEQPPSLLDLLNGPGTGLGTIRQELEPGAEFRKSNGHYWVVEQAMQDVTGEPFADLMRRLVFDPLRMADSSYDQQFPESGTRPVAEGHDESGAAVPGGWTVRPGISSAGLWTTTPDLAALSVAVIRSHRDAPGALLPSALIGDLLAAGSDDGLYGLGTSVDDTGAEVEFGHVGETTGYRSMMLSRLRAGTGFVVLTSADSGKEIHKFVALDVGARTGHQYGKGQGRTEVGYQ
jgi:amino acid adenylation domain-containing protein/non-ribosomal peptide synthase protein (TIGR01720 family)